ncbi:dimethyl sulfoxide reductase anchor subunit family protein [Bacillus massiliigorillae]|uniref:dimethyl sulfoxide reductase anchor subunit family protein n=1 Tax=Bacillus massiliigorillae TaxID=1243664 RepID=UPI0003A6AD85|nr:DmsC/YnfH family molybdoenzyme membrane anchor subunit [Bacillus massiliigorillae]
MHEWPLLIFTICMQAAIGGMVVLWFFHRSLEKNGVDTFHVLRIPLIVIAVLSFIGLGASFAHLGKPSHAFNAILGFGHSWMSREIVFTGCFIGLAVITIGLFFIQKKVNPWFLLVTALVGLVDVYSMAAIYSNTYVNGWDSANTVLSFYGTTLTLGAILMLSLNATFIKNAEVTKTLFKIGFSLAAVGIAVQLMGAALLAAFNGEVVLISGNMASASLADYQSVIIVRWIIEIIGMAIFGFYAISTNKKSIATVGYVALAAILIAEGMNRYVFYVLGS